MIRAQRVLLESAARTVATATPKQRDERACSARAYLSVTAASGTGGLTMQWRAYEKLSGTTYTLVSATAVTATGLYLLEIGDSLVAGTGNRTTLNARLPVDWDINVSVGDSSSYTYSLSVELTS